MSASDPTAKEKITLSPKKEPDLDGRSMFLGFTSRATIIFGRSARKCPGFLPDMDTSNAKLVVMTT